MNPFIIWLKWFLKSKKLLIKERGKGLKLGYLSFLKDVTVGNFNTFYDYVTIIDTKISDFVYVGQGTRIINASIGKFCSIGPDVKIGLGKHPPHFISTFPAFYSTLSQCNITFTSRNYFKETGTITIGNDVWIGANAIIMDDVKIGDGAIIAAGAVVTKDVEPYAIVGGIPAHTIKMRFTSEEISILMNFKWWDKDLTWLKKNFANFNAPEVFFKTTIHENP